MNKARKAIIVSNEISELKTYILGGYSQKVLIEGKKKTNPIVIFLHGLGTPFPFCVGCRGMFPELTEQFTMVYWDQLGSGINNHPIDESFSIDLFVDMGVELVKEIRKEFKESTINIFAVSLGSVLAAKVAEALPKIINKVVVFGQVLKQIFFNDEVYEALENSSMSNKKKQRVSLIKHSVKHSTENIKTIAGWIIKYTEGYWAKDGGKPPIGHIIRGLLGSPDYSLKDLIAIFVNGTNKNKSLLLELIDMDLSESLKKITIPYLILQGDADIVTSTKMISNFVETAENRNLTYIQVKDSGHYPSKNGMDVTINKGFEFFKE